MADSAARSHRAPPPEPDWLSEFPAEDEMDAAWARQPADDHDPFDVFAQEATDIADVPLRPLIEPPAAAVEPALRIVEVQPIAAEVMLADRSRRWWAPVAAAVATAAAVLAAVMWLAVPRAVTPPDLPPPPALEREAAVMPPPAAFSPLPLPVVPLSPPPSLQSAPASTVDPAVQNNNRAPAKPEPPPAPPPAASRPAPPAPTTPAQNPPALTASGSPAGPPRLPVTVLPPPEIVTPPPAPSRPAEPSRGAGSGTAAATTSPVDLAAAALAVNVAEIEGVLGGYRRAFNALDVARVQQVWPAVDNRALERAFRNLSKQTFEFESCQIEPRANDAHAICAGRASYVQKVGGRAPQVESRTWTFVLTKQSGRWLIHSVESKR
jgi:hypothetical protein